MPLMADTEAGGKVPPAEARPVDELPAAAEPEQQSAAAEAADDAPKTKKVSWLPACYCWLRFAPPRLAHLSGGAKYIDRQLTVTAPSPYPLRSYSSCLSPPGGARSAPQAAHIGLGSHSERQS